MVSASAFAALRALVYEELAPDSTNPTSRPAMSDVVPRTLTTSAPSLCFSGCRAALACFSATPIATAMTSPRDGQGCNHHFSLHHSPKMAPGRGEAYVRDRRALDRSVVSRTPRTRDLRSLGRRLTLARARAFERASVGTRRLGGRKRVRRARGRRGQLLRPLLPARGAGGRGVRRPSRFRDGFEVRDLVVAVGCRRWRGSRWGRSGCREQTRWIDGRRRGGSRRRDGAKPDRAVTGRAGSGDGCLLAPRRSLRARPRRARALRPFT